MVLVGNREWRVSVLFHLSIGPPVLEVVVLVEKIGELAGKVVNPVEGIVVLAVKILVPVEGFGRLVVVVVEEVDSLVEIIGRLVVGSEGTLQVKVHCIEL